MGISNNRFAMHHLGIGGDFSGRYINYPYKLLLSFGKNYGTYSKPYNIPQEVLYWSYEMRVLQNVVELNIQLAAEFNSTAAPIYGAGLNLRKTF
ncbi:hypothetical protein LZ575_12650 [Antarcticibacterium sp. 1MA-6-2]|uniref:hypothetical protein n=1 Tax=Antarcticibacterium sp. 1MA-6-2 TaxID=2908210 RepID=UPI001F3F15D8|nr:hypothetical protein [Antarcticibacterium sp. 1MA-6-2]UJH89849.1 hypothetical protein LZ575_12650 [Antarcticibacterium sp. 1MA-6-2]